jgi:hypothetical protein
MAGRYASVHRTLTSGLRKTPSQLSKAGMFPILISHDGRVLLERKEAPPATLEVEVDPMERLRIEAEKAALQASSPRNTNKVSKQS